MASRSMSRNAGFSTAMRASRLRRPQRAAPSATQGELQLGPCAPFCHHQRLVEDTTTRGRLAETEIICADCGEILASERRLT